MEKRQVTYAGVRVTQGNKSLFAHRGDIVEVTAEEAKRLDALGAVTAVDVELTAPGHLVKLSENASEQHVLNYLGSGTTDEIVAHIPEYSRDLLEKLLIEERHGRNRETLIARLASASGRSIDESTVKPVEITGVTNVEKAVADTRGQVTPNEQTNVVVDEFDAAKVLEGNEGAVLAYAEDHPDELDALLTAEQEGKARKGVVEGLTKLIES